MPETNKPKEVTSSEASKDDSQKLNKIILIVGLTIFLIGMVAALSVFTQRYLSKSNPKSETVQIEPIKQPSETNQGPTLTPERREIVANLENHVITIIGGVLSQPELTIKQHDQVEWQNKDEVNHEITGEGWGMVVRPGRNYSESFDQLGTFPYSDSLNPEISGTIIVQ